MSVIIRPARPDDAADIADVNIEVWRSAYRGLMPAAFLAQMNREESERSWFHTLSNMNSKYACVIAATDQNRVFGFGYCGSPRSAQLQADGEIFAINVSDVEQRQGVGTKLMFALARALGTADYRSVGLWVLEGNSRARAFYEALGCRLGGSASRDFGGLPLVQLACYWESPDHLASACHRRGT